MCWKRWTPKALFRSPSSSSSWRAVPCNGEVAGASGCDGEKEIKIYLKPPYNTLINTTLEIQQNGRTGDLNV